MIRQFFANRGLNEMLATRHGVQKITVLSVADFVWRSYLGSMIAAAYNCRLVNFDSSKRNVRATLAS